MGKTQSDEHGEYDPDAGSPHPVEDEDVGYTPCNAVLKYTFERYGERRYCTGMAESNFNADGSDFCKHHKSREALMKQHAENFKTGAYSKSHSHLFEHMPPHKKIIANDLYRDLIDKSEHDFDAEIVELEIDVSEYDFAPDVDTLVLDHPVPTEDRTRGKALWFAALDFITMESIKEEQFRVAATTTFEGRELAVGERVKTVSVTEDGREIKDTDEHHLNIALSRIQQNYEKHMKFGGVAIEPEAEGGSGMGTREWVVQVTPEEKGVQPEASDGEQSPVTEIEVPDED